MIETFYSEDLFVEKRTGSSKANHAVVFFHGFPGGERAAWIWARLSTSTLG